MANIHIINNFLFDSYPKNFMDCWPEGSDEFLNYIYEGFYKKRLVGFSLRNAKHTPKYFFMKIIYKLLCIHYEKHNNTDYMMLKKMDIHLYTGSAWWCLTDQAINTILKWCSLRRKQGHIIINSRNPDESFFQTAVMSDIKLSNMNEYRNGADNNLTFPFFSDKTHPFKCHPYTIEVDKVKEIMSWNKYLFARKFDMNITSSAKAMDYLDDKKK